MIRRLAVFTFVPSLFVLGCTQQTPPTSYHVTTYTERQLLGKDSPDEPVKLDDQSAQRLQQILRTYYSPPFGWERMTASETRIRRGAYLYQQHCVQCHGVNGAGDGVAAQYLRPRPRDYRRGIFKWKSTDPNSKPTRDDLLSVLRNGVKGTSMPDFALMDESDLRALVDYVIYLSQRGELERRLIFEYTVDLSIPNDEFVTEILDSIRTSWDQAKSEITEPKSPAPNYVFGSAEHAAAVARGRKLFLGEDAACYKCHGKDARANPADWDKETKEKMVDDWGFANFPRNLNQGFFHGGRRPMDVYRRIHNGIKGTQMPNQSTNIKLKPEDLWDLVTFVRALPHQPELLADAK